MSNFIAYLDMSDIPDDDIKTPDQLHRKNDMLMADVMFDQYVVQLKNKLLFNTIDNKAIVDIYKTIRKDLDTILDTYLSTQKMREDLKKYDIKFATKDGHILHFKYDNVYFEEVRLIPLISDFDK